YSLIYGHHMEYGKMFGALDDFLNRDYLKNHTSGTLIIGKNAEKTYSLEVFASMETNASEDTAFTPGESAEIRQYIKDNAKIYETERSERIIGLSTCADGDTVGRIIVFCYILE
ncbi:MAG: class B sortase, partial [Ruminococcus sp.]